MVYEYDFVLHVLRKREGEIILISRNEIYPYLLSFQKLRVVTRGHID